MRNAEKYWILSDSPVLREMKKFHLSLATEYINCLHWGTQEDGKGLSFYMWQKL